MKETIKYLAAKEGWLNLFVAYVDALEEVADKKSNHYMGFYKRFYNKLKLIRDEYRPRRFRNDEN